MDKGQFNKTMGVNFGGTDEWYTPAAAVLPLLKFIKPNSRILCPFDTEESEYVKVLSKNHTVFHSHIFEGKDFFQLSKPDVDYVISNPPYSKRTEILKQLYKWGIPFAMMFNSNGIFDSRKRFNYASNLGGGTVISLSASRLLKPRVRVDGSALYVLLLVLSLIAGEINVCFDQRRRTNRFIRLNRR